MAYLQQAVKMFRQRVGKMKMVLLQAHITFFTRLIREWFQNHWKELFWCYKMVLESFLGDEYQESYGPKLVGTQFNFPDSLGVRCCRYV